jgi:hypothetical protein
MTSNDSLHDLSKPLFGYLHRVCKPLYIPIAVGLTWKPLFPVSFRSPTSLAKSFPLYSLWSCGESRVNTNTYNKRKGWSSLGSVSRGKCHTGHV